MANHLIVTLALLFVSILSTNAHSHDLFFGNLNGVENGMTVKGVHQLKQYLQKYGYLEYVENHADNDEYDDAVEIAVKKYQEFYSLKQIGKLDSATIIQMAKPRCGFPDLIDGKSRAEMRPQYSEGLSKWASPMLLPYTLNSTTLLDMALVRPVIASAFATWSPVTVSNFSFREDPTYTPNTKIRLGFNKFDIFGGRYDGPGGVLATSAWPPLGLTSFDADESWSVTVPDKNQVDLESVALHEIGHLLGLDHSSVKEAVMYPTIGRGTMKRKLDIDDIQGIRHMYGLPQANTISNKIE